MKTQEKEYKTNFSTWILLPKNQKRLQIHRFKLKKKKAMSRVLSNYSTRKLNSLWHQARKNLLSFWTTFRKRGNKLQKYMTSTWSRDFSSKGSSHSWVQISANNFCGEIHWSISVCMLSICLVWLLFHFFFQKWQNG